MGQQMPHGSREFTQIVKEKAHWGPILSYDAVVT